MKNFNTQQIKQLITGVKLASEIQASSNNLRGFLSIFAYEYDEYGEYIEMTKFLKKVDEETLFFILRRYEIPKENIENGWYASEEDLINSIYREDIKGLKNIEKEILKYIEDISVLEPEWKCDIPL